MGSVGGTLHSVSLGEGRGEDQVGETSPLRSFTCFLAKKKRTLVLTPVYKRPFLTLNEQ